jgi:hypothetical protein
MSQHRVSPLPASQQFFFLFLLLMRLAGWADRPPRRDIA